MSESAPRTHGRMVDEKGQPSLSTQLLASERVGGVPPPGPSFPFGRHHATVNERGLVGPGPFRRA